MYDKMVKPNTKGFTMSRSIAKIFEISKIDFNREMIYFEGENCLSSLFIAKAFDKRPAHVIRDIEVAIKRRIELFEAKGEPKVGFTSESKFVRKYYKIATYKDKSNRETKKYYLTEKGFMNLCVQYKGLKAEELRELLIEEYIAQRTIVERNKLRAEVLAEIPEYVNIKKETKKVRKTLTDAINETVVLFRINQENKKGDGWYFKSYTNLIYKKLEITLPVKGVNPRDIFTEKQLRDIADLEEKVTHLIYENEKKELSYKESYQKIKEELV